MTRHAIAACTVAAGTSVCFGLLYSVKDDIISIFYFTDNIYYYERLLLIIVAPVFQECGVEQIYIVIKLSIVIIKQIVIIE